MTKDTSSKIKTVPELARVVEELRAEDKKVVHCHGVFDLLHPGHLKHFEAAKNKGDVLVVTLTKDEFVNRGPGRPIFTERIRAETLAAIECVDYVAINESPTAVEAIKAIKPDVYVKGSEYMARDEDITGKIHDEEAAVESVGGRLDFTDEVTFSSSNLINSYLFPYPDETKEFFRDISGRYSPGDFERMLIGVEDLKVLVVGDIIIDEYLYCTPFGKSQKDNIIAVRHEGAEVFAGGVLAAANHIAGFCENVTLATCLGTDNDFGEFVRENVRSNIDLKLFDWDDAPTVVKQKFVEPTAMRKLFEVCHFADTHRLSEAAEQALIGYLETAIPEFDLVLVADFGHGVITPRIVELLCAKAKFLAINVQTNSANIGFNLVTKFPRADYVCIDEPELRLACHDRFSDVETLMAKISHQLECDRVVCTLGGRGCAVYSRGGEFLQVPVFSREIVDTIGAGDAYFSTTAPCVAKGYPPEVIGFVGNAVGAMSVLVVGNRSSVERTPLLKYIGTLLK
jgi:rfaE bifunctional protein nucleotidyltransferase chain/domain